MTATSASNHKQSFTYFGYSTLHNSARCFPNINPVLIRAIYVCMYVSCMYVWLLTCAYTKICSKWLNYQSKNQADDYDPQKLEFIKITSQLACMKSKRIAHMYVCLFVLPHNHGLLRLAYQSPLCRCQRFWVSTIDIRTFKTYREERERESLRFPGSR